MSAPSARGQLALDLPHDTGHELGDFMPSPCNRAALDLVMAWPNWPAVATILEGPAACGKTHLARVFADLSGAVALRCEELWEPAEPLGRVGQARACVVDDADAVEDEVLLFHLYNRIAANRGHLLLTARRPLAAWALRLPDLISRLRTADVVRVAPPDDTLLGALLVKQFADRQLRVDAGVVEFLSDRMERSFAGVRALVAALDRASLRARRPITAVLARAVIDELAAESGESQTQAAGAA